jgi:hypothetical protein
MKLLLYDFRFWRLFWRVGVLKVPGGGQVVEFTRELILQWRLVDLCTLTLKSIDTWIENHCSTQCTLNMIEICLF